MEARRRSDPSLPSPSFARPSFARPSFARPSILLRSFALRSFLLAALAALAACMGCGSSSGPGPGPPPAVAPGGAPFGTTVATRPTVYPGASDLLKRMIHAYRTATTYEDQATIELSYRDGPRVVRDAAEISVLFERPNRLRLVAYQARVVADGTTLHAQVNDPGTSNLDGQVIERACPEQLRLRELYFDPLLYDQLGSAVLSDDAGRQPLQLELLLAGDEPQLLASDELDAETVGVAPVDGHDCYHIRWKSPRGEHELWLDMEQFLLRRLAYPRGALIEPLAAARDLQDVRLVAHFKNATLRKTPDADAFRWNGPVDAKRVRFLVAPPQPLPSQLFGRVPASFALQTLDGAELPQTSFQGKIAVLVFFHDHPACESTLRQLSAVRAKRESGKPEISFLAVCTEPSSRGNGQVRDILQRWQVDLPLARDLKAIGRDVLNLDGAPALVVFGPDGRVQIVEFGANPNLERDLTAILDRLARGDDLAAELLAGETAERRRYDQELAIAQGKLDPLSPEIQPPLLPAAGFKKLKASRVTPSFAADQLQELLDQARSPANAWRIAGHGQPARLTVDDRGRIAFADAAGQTFETKAVPDWSIRAVATRVGDEQAEQGLGVLGVNGLGQPRFLALDASFAQLWSYAVPHGGVARTCPVVQSVELFAGERPYWLVVAADGTVHVLSADGQFTDFLAAGKPITGLALSRLGNRSVLIVATESGAEAWEITK